MRGSLQDKYLCLAGTLRLTRLLAKTMDFDGVLQAMIAVADAVAAPPESPWNRFAGVR
jgi:hypothetical protein